MKSHTLIVIAAAMLTGCATTTPSSQPPGPRPFAEFKKELDAERAARPESMQNYGSQSLYRSLKLRSEVDMLINRYRR